MSADHPAPASPANDAEPVVITVDAADPRGSQVVFVCDRPADTDELYGSGGLADVLARAGHNVIVAVVDTPSQQTLRAAREAL